MNALLSHLSNGVKKIRSNTQLVYTLFVAAIIVAAFVFMADRFITIATDAENRLVNVRIGSLQDAFVSFAADHLDDPAYLNDRIKNIAESNETIRDFRVVRQERVADGSSESARNAFVVIASNHPNDAGKDDQNAKFLYTLASSDPNDSVTFEFAQNGERMFNTARAITDHAGTVLGVVMTTQTLSAADIAIQKNINNSLALLIVVIIVILLLFLRHSKIIDYMDLYKRLKEVDQLKDDFVAMASHELRTPLTVIRGFAEYMREAPELKPETKEYAIKIDASARDLDALVSDILDVSRIQQGRMTFALKKIDPRSMLEGVVASFAAQAKEKGLELSFDAERAEADQMVTVDESRLKQVFVNIIGNALKYTKSGYVRVSQYVQNGRLYVRVEDTGLGISAEAREHLFEKFYRIKSKETEDIRGTGLGLWITAQIIKEMSGTISIESIKGVGSHFIISFPLATPTP